jgi:Mn2+/Fe2+ NRAMP family transporter
MILMALVIAMFVIVGVYVGYHASQQVEEEGGAHNINIDLEIINQDSGLVQILQNPELKKTIL